MRETKNKKNRDIRKNYKINILIFDCLDKISKILYNKLKKLQYKF